MRSAFAKKLKIFLICTTFGCSKITAGIEPTSILRFSPFSRGRYRVQLPLEKCEILHIFYLPKELY